MSLISGSIHQHGRQQMLYIYSNKRACNTLWKFNLTAHLAMWTLTIHRRDSVEMKATETYIQGFNT
jgi:hypothetical protein